MAISLLQKLRVDFCLHAIDYLKEQYFYFKVTDFFQGFRRMDPPYDASRTRFYDFSGAGRISQTDSGTFFVGRNFSRTG